MRKPLTEKIQNKSLEVQMALIAEEIDGITEGIENIQGTLKGEYMKKDVFDTYKQVQEAKEKAQDARIALLEKIVFGLIGLIVVAVIGAVINLVVK